MPATSFGLRTYADDSIQVILRQVRSFLRDHPEVNALLDGEETGDALLELYVDMAVDDWNTTPPLFGAINVQNHPGRSLMIFYVCGLCLWSAAILQARNDLQYSDGGISVATSNKSQIYQQLSAQLMAVYEQKKLRMKKSQNTEMAYGGLLSEYSLTTFAQYQWSSYDSYANLRDGFKV